MIAHLIHNIVLFAQTHTLLAYGLAFLLTGAKAFPVFGALVPGTAVIIALGALVPSGALNQRAQSINNWLAVSFAHKRSITDIMPTAKNSRFLANA